MKSKHIDTILFIAVLCIGALLRFYGYNEFSFANDELGALARLQFTSFSDLIAKGVYIDGHPAGVQVFLYYWAKIFGISEASVRLPFVLCSTAALYFTWLIAKSWFNPTAAILSVIALATLEFPLEYSRIARSYAPGLLFLMMNIWYWTKILFSENKTAWKIWIGYGITAALCMYTHYFSFFSALIAGVTGLFLIRKQNLLQYILGACLAFLLYIPSLKIFYHHFFEVGGLQNLAGYVQKPEPGFIVHYLKSCFNHSLWLSLLFTAIPAVSFVVYRKKIALSRFHLLSFLWFLLPYLIGHIYSVYRDPLLQERMLLFSFPFLLFFIFSFFPDEQRAIVKALLAGSLIIICTYSTVIEKRFYQIAHFPQMSETISMKINEYAQEKNKENISGIVNIPDPYYIDYYLTKFNNPMAFAGYRCDSKNDMLRVDSILKSSSTPYFLYAWITMYNPTEILSLIRSHFPFVIHTEWYKAAEIYLFAKEKPQGYTEPDPLFNSRNDFEIPLQYWTTCDSCIAEDTAFPGKHYALLNTRFPFSPTFSAPSKEVFKSVNDIIFTSVSGFFPMEKGEVKLCIAFENQGATYEWHDMDFRHFISESGQWGNVYFACRVPELRSKNDLIKIFVWNIKGADVFIDDFHVWVEKGNPVIFGARSDQDMLNEE